MNRLDLSTPWGVTLALLPEIILTAWTLVVLLVVSWRHETAEDSRLAGWLSFAGVLLSAAGLAALWVNGVAPDGLAQMVALDPFRYAAVGISLLAAGATILLSLGYMEREQLLAPEYYPLILSGHRRHDVPGRGRGPHRPVPRARGDVGGGVRPGRLQPRQRVFVRGGAQVLPDRRVRLGLPALRHRPGLRRDRHDQPQPHRRAARREVAAAAWRRSAWASC